MGDILEPLTIDTLRTKISSKEMIAEFLKSGEPSSRVKVENTGRPEQSVYLSLRQYLLKHPELGVSVQMNEGRVVLFKQT